MRGRDPLPANRCRSGQVGRRPEQALRPSEQDSGREAAKYDGMPLIRPLVAVAVGSSLVLAGTAGAATKPAPKPKPVCKLIVDAPGDANLIPSIDFSPAPLTTPASGPSSGPLDVLSADLAGDKKRLTAVIRVKKLAATDPTFAPTGMEWDFGFIAEDQQFDLVASTDPTGKVTFAASYFQKTTMEGALYPNGSVAGVFDTAKNEVRITAPYDLFAAQATIKAGTVITGLTASTVTQVAVPEPTGKLGGGNLLTDGLYIDQSDTKKTYKTATPSCVTPGK